MRTFRRLLAAAAAAITLAVLGMTPANAQPDLYATPGGHITNGRLWDTDCEMYSSNVVRCTTKIWATQVKYSGGTYKQVTGWYFNNLTYLPAPRAVWAANPLANKGAWTSGGRQWKTDCDSAATGRGGCRSYVWAKVSAAHRSSGSWAFSSQYQWVFNNIVLFSTSTKPHVTSIPDDVIDQAYLTPTGLGPLQVGTDAHDLQRLGYVFWNDTGGCDYWDVSDSLKDRGVELHFNSNNKVTEVVVTQSGIETEQGAQVTMTYEEVWSIYQSQLHRQTKDGYQPVHTAVVRDGANELVFLSSFELTRPLQNSDNISMIIARKYDTWLGWEGC